MYVLFIIGLFGSIFMVISMMIVAMADSAMMIQEKRVADVTRMFRDIEVAISDGYLSEHADLGASPSSALNAYFPYLSWTEEQMTVDPWGEAIDVYVAERGEILYADGTSTIEAPVYAFLFLSRGVNQQLDSTFNVPPSYNDIRTFEVGGDDIARSFTTLDAASHLSNELVKAVESIRAALVNDYRAQYREFSPKIEQFYASQLAAGNAFDLDDWIGHASLIGEPDYPVFQSDIRQLGMDKAVDNLPEGAFRIDLTSGAVVTDPVRISVTPDGAQWQVSIQRDVTAQEIVVGN